MVIYLATRETLTVIKKNVENCLGQKVSLRTNKGKRKVNVREGVIEDAFPSVFTVRIEDGLNSARTVSYSYSDILTETVEVTLLDGNYNIESIQIG